MSNKLDWVLTHNKENNNETNKSEKKSNESASRILMLLSPSTALLRRSGNSNM